MPLHNGVSQGRSAEAAAGFTEAQARWEASRCLRCDLAYLCPTVVARRAENGRRHGVLIELPHRTCDAKEVSPCQFKI